MKVAIVHDWFVGWGAEAVVYELHKMYPNAPIYTSYCNDEWRKRLNNRIITGYLQHWPFRVLRKFIPFLRGLWFSRLDLSEFDLVISSSGAEAKFIKVKPGARHISYIHAPTHYYWSKYDQYLKHPGFGGLDPIARLGLKILVGPMRRWDYKAAQRPDQLIANSNYTKNQIKKYYGRDAVVIHPPVDVDRFKSKDQPERSGFVITGRQTPYKRFDLAVEACTKLNLPLTVVGDGPDNSKLRKAAGPTITFTGKVSGDEVVRYIQNAQVFIFPGIDDFGIVAVEALAAGTPVIAYKDGGALDYIQNKINGLFFNHQTLSSLAEALASFSSTKIDSRTVSQSAQQFSPDNFRKNMASIIDKILKEGAK